MAKKKVPLLCITAKTIRGGMGVDLFFCRVSEAAYHNIGLKDFRVVGYEDGERLK